MRVVESTGDLLMKSVSAINRLRSTVEDYEFDGLCKSIAHDKPKKIRLGLKVPARPASYRPQ
ncbi:hypothetical protein EAN04_24585 [Salmonella enterica]|nr:hypothetical protein [Salmonella enterica]